jgi:hypothetical protein
MPTLGKRSQARDICCSKVRDDTCHRQLPKMSRVITPGMITRCAAHPPHKPTKTKRLVAYSQIDTKEYALAEIKLAGTLLHECFARHERLTKVQSDEQLLSICHQNISLLLNRSQRLSEILAEFDDEAS